MIKLSKKGSYALKAILFIAESSPDMVKIKEISTNQNISESMLRRLIADLEKTKIIKTIKGRNWWVILKKELNKISIYDILFAVWENLAIRDCTKWWTCENSHDCNTTNVLSDLQRGFNSLLKIYTLDKIKKLL